MIENDNNVKSEKTRKYIIVIILLVIIIGLVGFICYDKLINKNDKEPNNEQEKIEDVDEDNNLHNSFVIVERSSNASSNVYLADDEYFKDGTKESLFSKEIISMNALKNKIFYVDNTKKLYVYNIKNGKEEVYDLGNVEINYNTQIIPGEKNAIVALISGSVIIIDLENKTNYVEDIHFKGGSIIFDEANGVFYYTTGLGDIYQYNISSKESTLVNGLNGIPSFLDDKFVYSERSNDGYLNFYSLDKKTLKVERLNIDDLSSGHVIEYVKINDSLFVNKVYDYLLEYKDGKASHVLDAGRINILKIGNELFVAEYIVDNEKEYADAPGWKLTTVYTYDVDNSKLENYDNQFSKDLFEKYEVYNLYE